MEDFSKYQDVFGQLLFLKTYTQLVLCFSTPCGISSESITKELKNAALKLTHAFPFLAGQVITEGAGPATTGLCKIIPYGPHAENSILHVKDCTALVPPYAEIIKAKAPFSLLDGDIIAPRKGLPLSYEETEEDPAPVLIIQANFIVGGLLLTFAGQHNIMDMNGQGQIIRLFAKALRGESFSKAEIEGGNLDRRNIIPLLGPDEPLRDHSLLRPRPQTNGVAPTPPSEPAPISWAYFHFPASKLRVLKSLASKPIQEPRTEPPVPFISTNDVLSAFIWQRISAVRATRLPSDASTTLCRAANARRFLDPPVPETYTGHMVTCTFSCLSFSSIASTPLSTLTSLIRSALNAITPYDVRSLVTLIANEPDKGSVSYGASLDIDKDVLFSSWADLRLYGTDFGDVLGKPEFVRRQRFVPMESLIYLMPRTDGGDIDAAICLKDVDLEGLKGDSEWAAYAEYVG
jgi:trichothecene 3-O-acetyltransferase